MYKLHIRFITDSTQLTNFLLAASAATSIVFANPVADPDNDIANTVSVVDPAKVTPSTSPATPELANPLYDDICYKCAEEKDSCMKVRELDFPQPQPSPRLNHDNFVGFLVPLCS